MDLTSTAMFVAVATHGNFTQAAKTMRISKSYLSSRISQLEKDLGVVLLTRTTRKMSLTEAGARFFKRCSPALNELRSAQEEVAQVQKIPTGWVRVTLPVDFSESGLTDAFAEYLENYPEVKIEALYTDRFVDLVSENFDLAVRAGSLKDSSLIAKKVGTSSFVLAASKAYLKKAPPIQHPKDLVRQDCLLFGEADEDTWELRGPRGLSRIRVKARVKMNNLLALKRLVLAGQGIALLPKIMCEPEFAQGTLVCPLPGFQTRTDPIHLVFPASRSTSLKLKALLPILEKAVKRAMRD